MRNPKKSIIFISVMTVVSIIGLIKMSIFGNRSFILYYILLVCTSIPGMIFNYSLCKWGNKWQNMWSQKEIGTGEPSEYRLYVGKISSWLCFIVALVFALI